MPPDHAVQSQVEQHMLQIRSELSDMIPRLFGTAQKKWEERLDKTLEGHREQLNEVRRGFDAQLDRLEGFVKRAEQHADEARTAYERISEIMRSEGELLL